MQDIVSQTSMQADQKKVPLSGLSKVTRRWDPKIRHELRRFAQKRWTAERFLGLFPINGYRLRKQVEPSSYIWWVERDIPPYDRYKCAAYRVEISFSGTDRPQLIVRSGAGAYPVAPMSIQRLRATLEEALSDTPLIIQRQFGPALDP